MAISYEIDQLIKKYSLKKGIPENYLRAQILKESSGNPKALGDNGKSRGLMQIYEPTALTDLKIAQKDLSKLFEPEFAIDKGTDYLNIIKKRIGDTTGMSKEDLWQSVFMGYNSGPAYQKKAIEAIRNRGETPTFEKILLEMQKPGFGRTPIFKVTIPYAQSIVMGRPYAIAGFDAGGTKPMMASIVPTSATGIGGTLLMLVLIGGIVGLLLTKKGGAVKAPSAPAAMV